MSLLNALGSKTPVTVGYMKNSELPKMEDDSLLLKGTLAGFDDDAKILIDLPEPHAYHKLVGILVGARYRLRLSDDFQTSYELETPGGRIFRSI